MGYSLEQFSTECHRILKQYPGVEGRKQVCALVRQVLKDDAFIAASVGLRGSFGHSSLVRRVSVGGRTVP